MTTPETKQTEETWWEVTTGRGLMLTLPAPSTTTGVPADPAEALRIAKRPDSSYRVWSSTSQLTGRTYVVDLSEALVIKAYTLRVDRDRMERSVAKALGILSPSPSDAGPEVASPSDDLENPSGRSTGGRIKRNILH